MIRLNVGGTRFETTRTTLENSGYFRALLSGQWSENTQEEEIFIDRDPENFRHVLALLRDPNHQIPDEIDYELTFFGIEISQEKYAFRRILKKNIQGGIGIDYEFPKIEDNKIHLNDYTKIDIQEITNIKHLYIGKCSRNNTSFILTVFYDEKSYEVSLEKTQLETFMVELLGEEYRTKHRELIEKERNDSRNKEIDRYRGIDLHDYYK